MFITLRNLPHNVKIKDIKMLINERCNIQDVILSKLTREEATPTKKLTLGLADECDAAIVFRKLNGLHFLGQPLIVEDSRSKRGPAPGAIPHQRANPVQYQPRAMKVQTQQMVVQGLNAKGMMSTDYDDEPQQMIKEDFGYEEQQPMMMTRQETTLDYQPITDHYRRWPQEQDPMAQSHMSQYIDDRLREIRSQYDQELNQQSHEMGQLVEFNQPADEMSQSRHQINEARLYQPRHLNNQSCPQMTQPRQSINQPHHQINQLRLQINQPRLEIPQHHMNEPIPYNTRNKPQNINQLSSYHDDIPARNHQEADIHQHASRRPPYEDPRNDHDNTRHHEPYERTASGHREVVDWDIPSREVVLQQTDTVWGARDTKQAQINSREFELENAPNRMFLPSGHRSRDELRSNQIDDGNFEQYPNERHSYNISDDRYHYCEQTTHTEAYHSTNDRFYNDSPRPMNVNREFVRGAPDKPLYSPKEPERKSHRDDKYDDNRKRTYSDARHEERQSIGVGPSHQRQDSVHKRPKTEEYVHSHTTNKIEGNRKEAMGRVVAHTPNKNVSKKPKGKKPMSPKTLTLPVLGFKKFKFRHIIPIKGFKAFEQFMFANLKSKHVPTTVKHYNCMYTACKHIYNKISRELKLDLKKYAYFMLNYIQILVETSMGDKIYVLSNWKHKSFINSFHSHYTCTTAFNEFKAWFENFEELELKDATLKKPKKPKVKPVEEIPKPNAYKWVAEEKPSSAQEKPNSAQRESEIAATAQGKPSSAQGKPSPAPGKPSSAQGKPSSAKPSSAQEKPSSVQKKPSSAQGKPAGISMSQEQLVVKATAQGKHPLTAKSTEANEMATRKAKAILNLPMGTRNGLLAKMYSKMPVELHTAVKLEMAGIHETVTACETAKNVSLDFMRKRLTTSIKRAIANRVLDTHTHIAVTALVTFTPEVPSGAACDEFFNARNGRVLHLSREVALVLFTNNHTFTLMCADKDALVDGCAIKNIVALDENVAQQAMHVGIEDRIKSDKANEIVDIVCNNAYFSAAVNLDNKITELEQPIIEVGSVNTEQNSDTKPRNTSVATAYQNELNNGVKIKQESDTEVHKTPNMQAKQESNTQTKQKTNIEAKQESNTQKKQTTNIQAKQESNIQNKQTTNLQANTQTAENSGLKSESNEDRTPKPQSPIEDDIDEIIQISDKVINEDEEIFMCEDDLEEFEL